MCSLEHVKEARKDVKACSVCACVCERVGGGCEVITVGVCCRVHGLSCWPPHHLSPCVTGNGLIDHFLVSPLGTSDNQ